MPFPKGAPDFDRRFRTEAACRDYLSKLRWPDGFLCSRCGHEQAWRTRRGLLHCAWCRADVSLTAGTLFHGSRMPLRLWLRAIWSVTGRKDGITAAELQRVLGLGSYRTAWLCLHKLRKAMDRPNQELLSGRIELIETVILGEHVGIAVEVQGNKCGRLRLVHLTGTNSLEKVAQTVATAGSRIIGEARSHWKRSVQTPSRAKWVAAALNNWLLNIRQGGVSYKHLPAYLNEFVFRFYHERNSEPGALFYRLVQQAVAVSPEN